MKNRCLFEVLKNDDFPLHSSTCESRNALITYITHSQEEKFSLEQEDFDKCIKGKVEGFSSTLKKIKNLSNLQQVLERHVSFFSSRVNVLNVGK